ncbi:UPF0481 protein At3g47200-like [Camellia sinensis]|uniref:UPF0481 protein At3g47200-like n=1 Tax=Camellia sinensis TaxID=4442 RepID=UPI001036B9EB|nr:UPF0481 protein At3g47200-like [Camellia sinensis]
MIKFDPSSFTLTNDERLDISRVKFEGSEEDKTDEDSEDEVAIDQELCTEMLIGFFEVRSGILSYIDAGTGVGCGRYLHMSKKNSGHVSLYIDEKLSQLSPTRTECCIFRVPDRLRRENEKAYEPEILAIGPYHHGKDNLKQMEENKLWYLQKRVKQRNETSVDRYVRAMRESEERAQKSYEGSINLNADEFVQTMLLDGCFIINPPPPSFTTWCYLHYVNGGLITMWMRMIPFTNLCLVRNVLRRDVLLFENQLPFFILVELFNMTKVESPQDDIVRLSLNFLRHVLPHQKLDVPNAKPIHEIKHILNLVHDGWCSSFAETRSSVKNVIVHWNFIDSATELQEAGVEFKMVNRSSTVDINFTNGVVEIPQLRVTHTTESPLRNLGAYEQCLPDAYPKYVCDYIAFMNWLINSSQDVEILRRSGIIENWIGDEVVNTMLNKIDKNIMISVTPFSYSENSNKLNKHCKKRLNVWMANLRPNYFNSPWSLLSFLSAVLLLVLTILQTVFSILSYVSPKS